jgi:regulatory protein
LTRLLRERPRSVAEVRERLARRRHDEAAIEETIRAALDTGLLDDRKFAKLWIVDRLLHHPLSRAAVARELADKGIEPGIVEASIDEHYPAVREIDLAWELAGARYARLSGTGIERERCQARTMNYLTRRGFSWELARDAVRRAERAIESG